MVRLGRFLGIGTRGLGVLTMAFLLMVGLAARASAGGVIMVIPAYFTSDELYDENGDTIKPAPDFEVKAPNLGFLLGYNWAVSGILPEDWNPVVGVNVLFWLVDVDVTANGTTMTSGFEPAFFWPIVYLGSKYLDLNVGFEFDLSPQPDPARGTIPNTDLSEALTFGGTLKYPVGDFVFSAGADYLLTFEHELPDGTKENPSDWLILRGAGSYTFPVGENAKLTLGAMLAYYRYSAPETNGIKGDTGNHFFIQPQLTLSVDRFFISVYWGTVDEYTNGGISFSGKNSLVKKATGFRAYIGYTFD